MNDFNKALVKWDLMAEEFRDRIDRQVRIINRLIAESGKMESCLRDMAESEDETMQLAARQTLREVDELRKKQAEQEGKKDV